MDSDDLDPLVLGNQSWGTGGEQAGDRPAREKELAQES